LSAVDFDFVEPNLSTIWYGIVDIVLVIEFFGSENQVVGNLMNPFGEEGVDLRTS
jgi:hypothetical protein